MLSSMGKYRDRNPEILPAGKLFNSSDTAKDCMKSSVKEMTDSKANKPLPKYKLQSHGISTKASTMAKELVNPKSKSYFQYQQNEKLEESIYASRKRAPLGRSHDQHMGLPSGFDITNSSFGLATSRCGDAGTLISPLKTQDQVVEESRKGFELYRKSHNVYDVGESPNRGYDWSRIPEKSSFGVVTPHDNRGLNTKKSLKWMHETLSEKGAQLTSKRVDDFRERSMAQVGAVHDPIKDTLNVGSDHTFGVMVEPDQFGAGDLIHMRRTESFLRGKDRLRGLLAAVRQHLKKANYHNFKNLKEAFQFYDKDKSGKIDVNELRDVCLQFNIPVQAQLLDLILLECCDHNHDEQIDYVEFANFLNWKDKMGGGFDADESDAYEKKILGESHGVILDEDGLPQADILRRQVDTCYSRCSVQTSEDLKNNRPYGIPTIRSDLPAPRIRKISDHTNYGDESDSSGLVNPSIYSNNGVYPEDFFKFRQPKVIRKIFATIGHDFSQEYFDDLWKKASEMNSDGKVSVQSFQEVLKMQTDHDDCGHQHERNLPIPSTLTRPKHYDHFHKIAE